MQFVNSYRVDPNTVVTLETVPPGDDVVSYSAALFRNTGGQSVRVRDWDAADLENGRARFTFDATSGERYEISLGATVSTAATIESTTRFSINPPADDPNPLNLTPDEGLNVRVWFFFPFMA